MATYYWVNRGTGNWNVASNWSTSSSGTYPGNAPRYPGQTATGDVATFNTTPTSASNCIVNINATVQTLIMTTYPGTLTFIDGNTITLTFSGTIFNQGAGVNIVRTGASINGTNIKTLGTTTTAKTITVNSGVSVSNALSFEINNTVYVATFNLTSGGKFKNLSVVQSSCYLALNGGFISVYGNLNLGNNGSGANSGQIYIDNFASSISASSMVNSTYYTITSVGNTDFTLYGAPSNTINTTFLASGPGTGTGTVATPLQFNSARTINSNIEYVFNIGGGSGPISLRTAMYQGSLRLYYGLFNSSYIGGGSMEIYNTAYLSYYDLTTNFKPESLYLSNTSNDPLRGNYYYSDFTNTTITVTGGANVSIPFGTVVNQLRPFGTNTVSGTNITFNTINLDGLSGGVMKFGSGSSISVRKIQNTTGDTKTIESSTPGSPFTLTKIGGGCDYFIRTSLKGVTGLPATTWYANTSLPTPYGIPPTPSYSNIFNAVSANKYLTVPNNAVFDFSSGNFTIEAWVYSSVITGEQTIYTKRSGDSGYAPIILGIYPQSGTNRLYIIGSTNGDSWDINPSFTRGNIIIPLYKWTHVAVVRNGTTITGYVNGVADSGLTFTGISAALMSNANSPSIGLGGDSAMDYQLSGEISNLRVVKGTAVYTSNFTPSTSPLTTTSQGVTASQVSLLTCQSATIIDNSPNNFSITNFGPVSSAPTVASGDSANAVNNFIYFGQNVDAGGNTNINFTQYPALGNFNNFF